MSTARRRSTDHASASSGRTTAGRSRPHAIGMLLGRPRSRRTARLSSSDAAMSRNRRAQSGDANAPRRRQWSEMRSVPTTSGAATKSAPASHRAPRSVARSKPDADRGGALATASARGCGGEAMRTTGAGRASRCATGSRPPSTGPICTTVGIAGSSGRAQRGASPRSAGSASAVATARVQTRWRVAAEPRRSAIATTPARPSTSVAFRKRSVNPSSVRMLMAQAPSWRARSISRARRSSSSSESFAERSSRSAATTSSGEPSKNVRTMWRSAERLARSRATHGT